MSVKTQLLCTFAKESDLDSILLSIVHAYTISFNTIYILENVDVPNTYCCTYNVDMSATTAGPVPEATISLHRKKATNTLYTINALNMLIAELNNGHVDKNYKIIWENYNNVIMVTAYGKLKKINTKLFKIMNVSDILV